jgi:GT2 family glycosyltransferase
MNARPRIAVLIPSYNCEHIIESALESLAQNSEPHDVIIVDDGSAFPLEQAIPPREGMIILRPERNIGISRALNMGLEYIYAHGYEYVARLDADDRATPDRLTKQRTFLDAHPEVVLLGTCGRVVSEEGAELFFLNHPTEHAAIMQALYYNSCFLHPSLMIRTEAMRAIGGYNPAYDCAEDYDMIRRMARYGKLANLPEYLLHYMISTQGISVSKRKKQLKMRLRVQWNYRDLSQMHCIMGMCKTMFLWFLPAGWVASIKKILPTYHKDTSSSLATKVI